MWVSWVMGIIGRYLKGFSAGKLSNFRRIRPPPKSVLCTLAKVLMHSFSSRKSTWSEKKIQICQTYKLIKNLQRKQKKWGKDRKPDLLFLVRCSAYQTRFHASIHKQEKHIFFCCWKQNFLFDLFLLSQFIQQSCHTQILFFDWCDKWIFRIFVAFCRISSLILVIAWRKKKSAKKKNSKSN